MRALAIAAVAICGCAIDDPGPTPFDTSCPADSRYPAGSLCDPLCTVPASILTGECRVQIGSPWEQACASSLYVEPNGVRGCCVRNVSSESKTYFGFFGCE
jgi:hypothetical protein